MNLTPLTFTELPEGYRLATLDDFHNGGQLRLGRPFILYARQLCQFEMYTVKDTLRASSIKPYIEQQRCYVHD